MRIQSNAAPYAAKGAAMPRARNIKPGFFVNDELCELPPLARLLFVGLWCVADRAGRMLDRPKRIRLEVLPADDCDVDAMLWQLHAHKFIVRYEVGDESLIEVCNWAKHQHPHNTEKHSTLPPASTHGARVKSLPEKQLSWLTVKAPLDTATNPSDSLIPDSLIPDSKTLVNQGTKNLLSSSAQKPAEPDREVVSQVFEYWQKTMNKPRAKLDDKRRKLIRHALALGYTPRDLCKAIRGCSLSPHHMGQNDRATAYNGLDLIFRNADKIDGFIAIDDNPPANASRPLTRDDDRRRAYEILTGKTSNGSGNEPFTIDA